MPWILLSLLLITQTFAASIPVLGMNEEGEAIEGHINEEDYVKSIRLMKDALDEKVSVLVVPQSQKWRLDRFSLGLGLAGEIGVGPFKYSSTLKQRFFFSR